MHPTLRTLAAGALGGILAVVLMGAGIAISVANPAGWFSGFASADNLMLRSDGTAGGIQGSGVTVGDDGSLTMPDESFVRINEDTANRTLLRINSANTGFGQGGVGNPAIIVGGTNVIEVDNTSASAPRVANRYPIELDAGGSGSEALLRFAGVAGNRTATIGMTDANGGACDAAAGCDSWAVDLPASPASGSSVRSMRVTSQGALWTQLSADPVSPAEGACWYNTTDDVHRCRDDAATIDLGSGGASAFQDVYDADVSDAVFDLDAGGSLVIRSSAPAAILDVDDAGTVDITGTLTVTGGTSLGGSVTLQAADSYSFGASGTELGTLWVNTIDDNDGTVLIDAALSLGGNTAPVSNGTRALGNTAGAWDSVWVDNINLQQTTAGEATISGEGAAGASTVRMRVIEADGTTPNVVADGVGWGFWGPASPASGASVEMLRVTTSVVVVPNLLRYGADTTLACSSGAVTITKSWHKVDSEDTNPDTLSTINGGTDGDTLVLMKADEAITVDEAGNILVPGASVALDGAADTLSLLYDGSLSKWVATGFSDNN